MQKIKILILVFVWLLSTLISCQSYAECFESTKKFDVGFFNGIWNTERQARISAKKIKDKLHRKDEIHLFYNHTSGYLADILEVFEQRFAELSTLDKPAGTYADNLSLFLSGVQSTNDSVLNAQIRKFTTDLNQLKARTLANPITEADYQSHDTQLSELLSTTSKVLLIAHSQGNLFLNHAYEATPALHRARLAALHLAPASLKLHGLYLLSSNDLVINSLQFTVSNPSRIASNISIPINDTDVSGHELSTYLNHSAIEQQINTYVSTQEKQSLPIGINGIFIDCSKGVYTYKNGRTETAKGCGQIEIHGDKGVHSDVINHTCAATMQIGNTNDKLARSYTETMRQEMITKKMNCLNNTGIIYRLDDHALNEGEPLLKYVIQAKGYSPKFKTHFQSDTLLQCQRGEWDTAQRMNQVTGNGSN